MKRFALTLLALALLLGGAVLIMAGSMPEGEALLARFHVPVFLPGGAAMAAGIFVLFKAGRRGRGGDDDPESHLAFSRDARDQHERMGSEDFIGGEAADDASPSDAPDSSSDDDWSHSGDDDDP